MNKNFRQIYHKIIAIILLVVITLPVILQPGHYLFIEHDHHHQSVENTLSSESEHFNCAIDDFQLTNVTLHTFLKVSQITCLDVALRFPHKQINSKRELDIPFSLRAPPFPKLAIG